MRRPERRDHARMDLFATARGTIETWLGATTEPDAAVNRRAKTGTMRYIGTVRAGLSFARGRR